MTESYLRDFEQEATRWLGANCPISQRQPFKREELVYAGRNPRFPSEDAQVWLERMVEKGWTVPTWPTEYGGAGLSPQEHKALQGVMRRLNCRVPLIGHGIWMLGPALLEFGTPAQKRLHLPAIARGEIRWCQGYSEPGAGSDLASLRCRAEDKGDHFLVNGQKCWTTDGHLADWIFVLVRSDFDNPIKQAGISFLLVDMQSPGVEARPVKLLNESLEFSDTYFDDVRVPKENLVGGLHEGWAVAKALLVHERTMISQMQEFAPKPPLDLADSAKRYVGFDARGKLTDHTLRGRITSHLMNMQSFDLAQRLAFEEGRAGRLDPKSTSYFKAFATEEIKRRDDLQTEILGTQGLGWEGAGFDSRELEATRLWLMNRSLSIGGGTTEVQRNLIAKALNLPKD